MSYNALGGIAVSRLGVSIDAFYRMSPVEFHYAMQDWREGQITQQRTTYNSMRLQTMVITNMFVKRGNQIKDPRQLFHFPWDDEKSQEKQTVEEMKNMLYTIAAAQNRRIKKG